MKKSGELRKYRFFLHTIFVFFVLNSSLLKNVSGTCFLYSINEELEQKILILNEKLEKMRNSSSNNSSRQVPHSTTSNTAKPQLDPKNPFSNMKEKAENKKQPNFWIEGFQQEINDKDKYIDSLELQIEELSEQVKNLTVKLRKSQKDAIRANSSNIQKGQSQI